jgi:short subunit dehydrogenase-like uncharacterized protein
MKSLLLLYGATGYTGRLIAELAASYGLTPVLAGRNEDLLQAMGEQYGLAYRVFGLENEATIAAALTDVKVVLHAAGPFVHTAAAMMAACLQTGTHYLDITGEIDVFESGARLQEKAIAANIMIMPGTGFDVVPTDTLALQLKNKMPDASHLQLAFGTRRGGISHGTATSMVLKLGTGGAIRKEGRITKVPLGNKKLEVEVDGFRMFCLSIPWGDVSTAWHTTGIPHIEAYTRMSRKVYWLLQFQPLYNWALRTRPVKKWLQSKIDARPAGPSPKQRQQARSYIWGKVWNENGQSVSAGFTAPEGYTLTAHAALHIARLVLQNNWKAGYQTPAGCYGPDLVFQLPGVSPLHWYEPATMHE